MEATRLRRRTRRIAAVSIAIVAFVDIASALTLPLSGRLRTVRHLAPLAVPQTATVLVTVVGIGLLILARGVRRGQRHAWLLAIALLLASIAGHVVKGLDLEEALVAVAVCAFLLLHASDFAAPGNPSSARRAALVVPVAAVAAVVAGVIGVELHRPRTPLGDAVRAVGERLVGVRETPLPTVTYEHLLAPSLLAVGISVAVYACWLAFRPALVPRAGDLRPVSPDRARFLVREHGTGTLSYFALRDDKTWFVHGEPLVAYSVYHGTALVSPDPIGPIGERQQAWRAFREFADDHGWSVAVMGASADWLPVYGTSGMHEVYIGDEAVVDVGRFSLEGKSRKSLRQSVSRVRREGYRTEFIDPATCDPSVAAELEAMLGESRRGDVERGYSMTLGRLFDPRDEGLLLAVARDGDGRAAAFCQFVPARGISGWSLDLMRRTARPEVPNGLTEMVVVDTIEHLREQGDRGLALNFATFRAVLAAETGDRLVQRFERWVLERMGDSMQIESLWTFNEKFEPDWHPRYACYDSPEHLFTASLAVARAESFVEIPVIGRFLGPSRNGPKGSP